MSAGIGILGGTLDPIHCGHLAAAAAGRDAFELSRVLVLPSRIPPHRPVQPVASPFHRFAMACLAVSGLPGFEANNWNGIFLPAKTPRALVMQVNKDIVAALNSPDLKDMLFKQGLDAAPESPEAFGAYLKSEYAKWGKVIKSAGIKQQ